MDLGLEGLNGIVIGGSRGIGRAIALALASEGVNVGVCARKEEPLNRARDEIEGRGVQAFAGACDAGDPDALAAFLDAARERLGGVDLLVHNASALALGPSSSDWEESLRVDVMGAVQATDHVIPWMEEAGGGSILLVSSISGLEADPSPNFGYAAAKAALIAYAKKLGVLHAHRGIRANAIAPGSIEFEGGLWASTRQHEPAFYESVRSSIPWGRLGTPEEVANVAVFLLSPKAAWITGECVSVDGGQHRGMR